VNNLHSDALKVLEDPLDWVKRTLLQTESKYFNWKIATELIQECSIYLYGTVEWYGRRAWCWRWGIYFLNIQIWKWRIVALRSSTTGMILMIIVKRKDIPFHLLRWDKLSAEQPIDVGFIVLLLLAVSAIHPKGADIPLLPWHLVSPVSSRGVAQLATLSGSSPLSFRDP
jgi:hypothetical protein